MTFLFLPLQGLGMFIQVLMMWLLIFLLQNKEEGSSQKKKKEKRKKVFVGFFEEMELNGLSAT